MRCGLLTIHWMTPISIIRWPHNCTCILLSQWSCHSGKIQQRHLWSRWRQQNNKIVRPTCGWCNFSELASKVTFFGTESKSFMTSSESKTRKPSYRWQTRATLAKSLHGLRKSSGVVSYIAIACLSIACLRFPISVLYSNCICKMPRFGDIRLLKLPCPWNPV